MSDHKQRLDWDSIATLHALAQSLPNSFAPKPQDDNLAVLAELLVRTNFLRGQRQVLGVGLPQFGDLDSALLAHQAYGAGLGNSLLDALGSLGVSNLSSYLNPAAQSSPYPQRRTADFAPGRGHEAPFAQGQPGSAWGGLPGTLDYARAVPPSPVNAGLHGFSGLHPPMNAGLGADVPLRPPAPSLSPSVLSALIAGHLDFWDTKPQGIPASDTAKLPQKQQWREEKATPTAESSWAVGSFDDGHYVIPDQNDVDSTLTEQASNGPWISPNTVQKLQAGRPAGPSQFLDELREAEKSDNEAKRPFLNGGGPKRTDYNKKYGGSRASPPVETPITTMMLKNIPCRKTQEEVMEILKVKGFESRYDFFYLPRDTKFRANLGYAFINFLTPEDAERFAAAISGFRFAGSGSAKACVAVTAHVQGLENNLEFFKRTEVMRSNRKPYFSTASTGMRQQIS